jgi:hypothetical protein
MGPRAAPNPGLLRSPPRTLLSAALAALLGCGGGEALSPLGADDAGAPTDAGAGGAAPDAGTPKRTVFQRNPFGNVAESENLLWDGDFEWYSPFSDQYGWLAGSSASTLGFTFTGVEIGAACRSGVRCAVVKKHAVLAGIAVASKDEPLAVSLWAHVTAGPCSKVFAAVTVFDEAADPDVELQPAAEEPEATGWCHLQAVLDPRAGKPLLFLRNDTAGDVLVDDAVIKRAPKATSVKAMHGPLTEAHALELVAVRESVARLHGPHDPPPNAARSAYEKFTRRSAPGLADVREADPAGRGGPARPPGFNRQGRP